jgi:hypothetical protein
VHMAHGRDSDDDGVVNVLRTTSFQVGNGPKGEAVLSLDVGAGSKINFLLSESMLDQLATTLIGMRPAATGIHRGISAASLLAEASRSISVSSDIPPIAIDMDATPILKTTSKPVIAVFGRYHLCCIGPGSLASGIDPHS